MAGTVRFPTDAQESISADSAHFSGNKPLPEKDREHHNPGGSMTGFMKFLEKEALEQFEAGLAFQFFPWKSGPPSAVDSRQRRSQRSKSRAYPQGLRVSG
jgi:hypothetical protein